MNRKGLIFGLILCILNLADGFLTLWLIHLYGFSIEYNPLMRYLMEIGSPWFLLKSLCGLFVGILVLFYWGRFRLVRVTTLAISVFFASVVLCQIIILIGGIR